MKKITLYISGNVWVADHDDNGATKAIMGTGIIPTPYTDKADGPMVLERIAQLNPDYECVIKS